MIVILVKSGFAEIVSRRWLMWVHARALSAAL